jgi:periplasmic protein TonB
LSSRKFLRAALDLPERREITGPHQEDSRRCCSAAGDPDEKTLEENASDSPQSGSATDPAKALGFTLPERPLRPQWLEPAIFALVIAMHVGVFAALSFDFSERNTPVADIQVEIMPEGEVVTEVSITPTPDAAPLMAQESSNATSPDPHLQDDMDARAAEESARTSTNDIAPPPPKIMAPDPIPIPLKTKNIKREQALARERELKNKKLRQEEEARRAAAQYAQKRAQARAKTTAAHFQLGAAARRAGVRHGSGAADHMSNAAYAALVAAEINRHKFYPAAARASGAVGSVGVAFSIGSSGAIKSHAITRSSGNSALDAAAGHMLAFSHPPPPPGGAFHGSTTIHFNFDR